jgi:hypothetical protein
MAGNRLPEIARPDEFRLQKAVNSRRRRRIPRRALKKKDQEG